MFENIDTLNNFLINISQCTKLNGYFIGTCFNGKKIFKLLNSLKEKEIYTYFNEEQNYKLLEITKQYSNNVFNDDISSLGYAIDIYQSSINKNFREYLVNFDYLTLRLENYGFVLLKKEEAVEKNIPNSTGLFSELFTIMNNEIKANKRMANEYGDAPNMTSNERTISFLNRYFVYKKVRNVDAEKVSLSLMNKTIDEEKDMEEQTARAQEIVATVVREQPVVKKTKPQKLKGKIKLVD